MVQRVEQIKSEPGKDIAVFGGAELASSLINLDLVDELVFALHPILLGEGKPFFQNISGRKYYTLKECKPYSTGLISLTYERKR